MQVKAPKGVADILPEDIPMWRYMEDTLRSALERSGFAEIRLPIFEATRLFSHSIGTETDIVAKEMYTFQDKGGRSFSLRPEGTASAVRAYLEHRLYAQQPVCRLYYMGPMFRAERPQAGRYRQFHQLGAEVFGTDSPSLDAELLALLMNTFSQMKLTGLRLQLNSLGCAACRPQHRKQLVSFLADNKSGLCPDCQRRADTNPLRVFDCKKPGCQQILAPAPQSMDTLCADCQDNFEQIKALLNQLKINFELNPRLVRGLDYYTRTAFEITSSQLGAQNAVAGGGRFDGLVEQLGGPPTPAFGFAIGLERLLLLLQQQPPARTEKPWVYLALLGEMARREGFILQHSLRQQGITVQMNYADQGLKKQLKQADKLGAPLVLIMGEDEINNNKVIIRDMRQGTQEEVSLKQLTDKLKGALKN
jgi:histidyl-tRNA synthetase